MTVTGRLRVRLYNFAVAEEHMDVAAVLAKLNAALRLQYRSALPGVPFVNGAAQ